MWFTYSDCFEIVTDVHSIYFIFRNLKREWRGTGEREGERGGGRGDGEGRREGRRKGGKKGQGEVERSRRKGKVNN